MNASADPRPQAPRVFVRRALHTTKDGRRKNWIVYDCRGPKVFVRQFTFSFFSAAIKEADRLARTDLINPRACFGIQRLEYPERGEA